MDLMEVEIAPEALLGIPYPQKWEVLKPAIKRLYIEENRKLNEIISAIRVQCGFQAVESQYKYQIKKWQFQKSTSSAKKAAVCKVVQKRAQLGKSSAIMRNGQSLETKNLRRYLKKEARKEMALHPVVTDTSGISLFSSRVAQFGNRIFMNWNIPYGGLRQSADQPASHASPLSDIVVATPPSPRDTPSPFSVAIEATMAVDRTRMLVEGRHADLLTSMGKQERLTMSTWLYHFWLFSFKTAKHWGHGPHEWNADMLGMDKFGPGKLIHESTPTTPATNPDTPMSISRNYAINTISTGSSTSPNSLCRWSIHYREIEYEDIPSPPLQSPVHMDLDDEASWPPWPASHNLDFTDTLSKGLKENNFTSVGSQDVPLAMNQVVRAVQRSPEELHGEALGFSIMSRNLDLVSDILVKICKTGYKIKNLYPFHLAIAYLDGSRSCCNILAKLTTCFSLAQHYVNDIGHTVLDQFMITILKNHTSCLPGIADASLRKDKRFQGEDIDICGRWDADSAHVRQLLAKGNPCIPYEWKHVFCHTSVQAICHCIEALFDGNSPFIYRLSGLFISRCSNCGLKLQLLPLHTLLVVGFHLSRSGCRGETLFGILACLLCLLSFGAEPFSKANISLQALVGNEEGSDCDHKELDATELAEGLAATLQATWSQDMATTWEVIIYVLKQSRSEWNSETCSEVPGPIDDLYPSTIGGEEETYTEDDGESHASLPARCDCVGIDEDHNFFGSRASLATMCVAVKTELLTYRRLTEDDAWLSPNFDMRSLAEGLENGGRVTILLVENNMMKPFCQCGRFKDEFSCALTDDACAYYFSNLEDWSRTTFIASPADIY